MSWRGTAYIDKALPFGFYSAPKIFSALTDAMMWMVQQRGVESALTFFGLGPPGQLD